MRGFAAKSREKSGREQLLPVTTARLEGEPTLPSPSSESRVCTEGWHLCSCGLDLFGSGWGLFPVLAIFQITVFRVEG